jgi:hypothetical protein
MTRSTRETVDRLRVNVDADGYIGVLGAGPAAYANDVVLLTLGKTVRNGSGWHAFPMNENGQLWTTPCYLRTRKAAIRYLAVMTAWGAAVDQEKIR